MKPGLPWSVKGIEPDAREAAKLAARRSGMTLGEWLNSTILDSADGEQTDAVEAPRARTAAPSFERAANRLEDIAEKLSRLAVSDSAVAPRYGIHAARSEVEPDHLHKVLSRVESNERQTVEAFTAVNERLSSLSRQLAQSPRVAPPAENNAGFATLEKAVRNIVEHMEISEKRNRDTLKSLQDRMGAMSTKAQSTDSEQILRQAPAFNQLETRLADLARRIDRSEQAAPTTSPDLLRQEMADLASRIDQVRDSSEVLATRAQTQAVQTSQQELRAIEQRIFGLLKETQTSLASASTAPADVQRLRGEIERLNRRIDESQGSAASGQDVMALRSAVEQLSTRVAQGPDMRPMADMDKRILDITQRLEQTQAATRSLPQFAELENRIAELDFRFNETVAGRASAHSTEIEQRLAEVSDRLGRTETQLASMETIERAVNQLFDTIEQNRKWTEDVAEGAAQRMGERIMALGPQQVSLTGSPEIMALEQGLTAVREAAESADQRNQETLEAVHETLEHIVGKLSELETAAIGQRVAQAAAPQANFAAAPQAAPQHEEIFAAPAPENPFAEVAPQNFEPVAIQPDPTLGSNPFVAQFNAQPQAASAMMEQAPAADDFIAAARRAAGAAAQQKSILSGVAPGAARMSEETSRKLLNFGFLKRKANSETEAGNISTGLSGEIKPPPGFKPANSNTDNKRRKLLLMGLVLLAAVSAFTFNMVGKSAKMKAPVAPAAIEQSIEQPVAPALDPAAPATPVTPKAAPLETGFLEPEIEADPVLTGSLPQTTETSSISELVSGEAAPADQMPTAEVGTLKLREAAAMGDSSAQFIVATRYLNGEKVKQDYEKAAYWYGKAAAKGLVPAQYRLATMYERGRGVERDLKAALGWYERAASAGNVKSMHNAAVLASGQDLGAPDYARAFKWFSLGAAHGLKDSQFNLAVLIERGLGTSTNPADAYFWYAIAAQHNQDEDAAKRVAALAASLSQSDLAAVKARIASWSPETPPEAANVVAVNTADWGKDDNG